MTSLFGQADSPDLDHQHQKADVSELAQLRARAEQDKRGGRGSTGSRGYYQLAQFSDKKASTRARAGGHVGEMRKATAYLLEQIHGS